MKRRRFWAWTPFEQVPVPADYPAEIYQGETVWVNSRYTVWRREIDAGAVHLSIKRNDRDPIHDWRELQRIKNELCGPEAEAIELYPAESRLVDIANQYHLWVLLDGEFPVGFTRRAVAEGSLGGSKQRSFEEKPRDVLDDPAMKRLIAEWRAKKRGERALAP